MSPDAAAVSGASARTMAVAEVKRPALAITRLPAHVRIVAAVSFVLVVVATPRTAWWAFFAYAGVVGAVGLVMRVPARTVLSKFA